MRLIVAMLAALLALGCGIALAAQDETSGPATDFTPNAQAAELTSKRTATSQTFELPDGSLETRIFANPVNYRDASGVWKPIGDQLEEVEGGGIGNGSNAFDVSLPERLGEEPVRLSTEGQWVSAELLGPDTEEAQLQDGTASYESASGQTSFELNGLANGVKESIVLADPSQSASFAFDLSASSALTPSLEPDGAIEFRDPEDRVIVTLPPPVMSDSAPDQPAVSNAIHYELGKEQEGHWRLTVRPDGDWLSSPERVAPVRIDPTMTVGPSLDCVIGGKTGQTGWIDCASWGRNNLLVGYTPQLKSSEDSWWRSLLYLETSAIPSTATVNAASFHAYATESAKNTEGIELRKVTKPWTWQGSWSRYDAEHLWSTEGGDYSESLGQVLTSQRGSQSGWWEFQLPTQAVVGQAGTSLRMSPSQAGRKVEASFTVKGTHRYRVAVLITGKGAQVVASKAHTAVLYSTSQSRITANGFQANFGGLGRINVEFHLNGPQVHGAASTGCNARDGQHGVFIGKIRFHGESNFTSVVKRRANGEVSELGQSGGSCGSRDRPIIGATSSHSSTGYGVKAVLEGNNGFVVFSAGQKSIGEFKSWESRVGIPLGLRSIAKHGVPFTALSVERRSGMQIVRLAAAVGAKSALSVPADGLSARVTPPAPFAGYAQIEPCSMNRWSGSLRVSFPGRRQSLTGRDIGEKLLPQPNCASAVTSGR
jgi:hypothetical protein